MRKKYNYEAEEMKDRNRKRFAVNEISMSESRDKNQIPANYDYDSTRIADYLIGGLAIGYSTLSRLVSGGSRR